MAVARDIAGRLRARIFRDLHVGRLKLGDRLPSCRVAADHFAADHRTVAQAYRMLADEGVVEIRPRSGVFVAHQERLGRGGAVLAGTARWFRDVAVEGWSRDIPFPRLPELLARCFGGQAPRCACVETVLDAGVAIAADLSRGFGLSVDEVILPPERGPSSDEHVELGRHLGMADLVVTTAYHADAVEGHLKRLSLGCPLVVVSINPEWHRPLREAMVSGGLTIVHVDRQAPERFELLLGAEGGAGLRFISTDDLARRGGVLPEGARHYTVAARRLLNPADADFPRLTAPLLSEDTARAVAEVVIRINLDVDAR